MEQAPSSEIKSASIIKLFNAFYERRKSKLPDTGPCSKQINPVHILPSKLFKTFSHITFPYKNKSPKLPFFSKVSHQKPVGILLNSHACHASCPSYPSRFFHPHIWCREQITKFLMPCFSSAVFSLKTLQ